LWKERKIKGKTGGKRSAPKGYDHHHNPPTTVIVIIT
jgi:hypothetical protein